MANVRFHVGTVEILVAVDGYLLIDPEKLVKNRPRETWDGQVGPMNADGQVLTPLNCFVLSSAGKRILVDTGVSTKRNGYGRAPDAGQLLSDLAGYGIRPEDIDIVVNTHAHFDHIGGNTAEDGDALRPTFPRATHYLGEADWDYYTAPERGNLPSIQDNLLSLEKGVKLRLVDRATALTPHVRLVPAPGHSPGHMVVEISSGSSGAMIMGDSLHNCCHTLHPDWAVFFDVDTEQALKTRRALLEQVSKENRAVLVCHFPVPGIGTLRAEGEGWRWLLWDGR